MPYLSEASYLFSSFFSKLGTIEFYGRGSYKQNDDLKARWKIILSNLISSKKGVSIKNSGWPFSPRCGGGLAGLSLAVKFCEKVKLKFNFVSKISCEWPGIYIPLTVTKNSVVKFAHLVHGSYFAQKSFMWNLFLIVDNKFDTILESKMLQKIKLSVQQETPEP